MNTNLFRFFNALLFVTATGVVAIGNSLAAQEPDSAPSGSIEDIAWISGHWKGEAMGGTFEETWNPPMGGAMMGMFKFVNKDDIGFYELLTIVPDGESLILRLKHFDAGLNGWEEKDKSVEFPLQEIKDKEVRFDGLIFRNLGAGKMQISVMVDQGSGPKEIHFNCIRADAKDDTANDSGAEIRKVLKLDELISIQRNEATRHVALSNAIRIYLNGLETIDFANCPKEFSVAFEKHRKSWENSLVFFDSHSDLRGEMHELLDEIKSTDDAVAEQLGAVYGEIMDSWNGAESVCRKHGAQE